MRSSRDEIELPFEKLRASSLPKIPCVRVCVSNPVVLDLLSKLTQTAVMS
jgi:hypothetical protein